MIEVFMWKVDGMGRVPRNPDGVAQYVRADDHELQIALMRHRLRRIEAWATTDEDDKETPDSRFGAIRAECKAGLETK